MLLRSVIIALSMMLFCTCENNETRKEVAFGILNSPAHFFEMVGRQNDTAFLYSNYNDPGAYYRDRNQFCRPIRVEVSGTVDTRLPGVYLLHYSAVDTSGNTATITRTVNVVENKAGFLNGSYDVSCNCTVTIGAASPTVTNDNYNATVSTGEKNSHFVVVPLKIGPEYIVPSTILLGDSIGVDYFNCSYNIPTNTFFGKLSPSKNAFTIESNVISYTTGAAYHCKSMYVRRVRIRE